MSIRLSVIHPHSNQKYFSVCLCEYNSFNAIHMSRWFNLVATSSNKQTGTSKSHCAKIHDNETFPLNLFYPKEAYTHYMSETEHCLFFVPKPIGTVKNLHYAVLCLLGTGNIPKYPPGVYPGDTVYEVRTHPGCVVSPSQGRPRGNLV